MKKQILFFVLLLPLLSFSQNETILRQDGIVFPRMTSTQRTALKTAVKGQCIYNTDFNNLECYTGTGWKLSNKNVGFTAELDSTYFLPNFTGTIITKFRESSDSGNNFNPNGGVFTAPVKGVYHFDLKISFVKDLVDFDNIPVTLRFRVNGAAVGGQLYDRITLRSNYGQDVQYSTNIQLNEGDQVTVRVLVVSGNATAKVKIRGGSNSIADSNLSGFLIYQLPSSAAFKSTQNNQVDSCCPNLKDTNFDKLPTNATHSIVAKLEQNYPNPFYQNTLIRYQLLERFEKAFVRITNHNGQLVKEFPISQNGKGAIRIDAGSLDSGSYFYSLIVDGQMVDTKKMVLTK